MDRQTHEAVEQDEGPWVRYDGLLFDLQKLPRSWTLIRGVTLEYPGDIEGVYLTRKIADGNPPSSPWPDTISEHI